MLNTLTILGRLKEVDLENILFTVNYSEDWKKDYKTFCFITNKTIVEKLSEYCKEDDLIGIRAHVDIVNDEQVLVADKVSFLSSRTDLDKNDD